MKQHKWTMGGLLLIPVVALLVFGFWLSRSQAASKAPLSFGGFTVEPLPKIRRNRANPFAPDTLVKIKINIATNPVSKRISPFSAASKMRVSNEHLSDVRGVKYFNTAPRGAVGSIHAGSTSIEGDGSAKTYEYALNLAQYPKSVGPLTFHAIYATDTGFQLPVSVVVRK